MIPTFVPEKKGVWNSSGHFVTTVVKFREEGEKDNKIYFFDSKGNYNSEKNNLSKLDLTQKDIGKVFNLNNSVLQGDSNTCGFFTIEFIKEASKCNDFEELM